MEKVATMQRQFADYYENTLQAEIDSRKTDKGKAPYIKAKADGLRWIRSNINI